jgi:ABC-2 type transport system ATP-binding protein
MNDVRKTTDGHDLIKDLTLDVGKGELFGLIGPSGGGKTTTIRLMVGIYAPTEGEIRVMGVPPTRFTLKERQRIGYMPQHFFLHPTLTAEENLGYIAGIYGLGWLRRRKIIPHLLKDMELWDARHRLAGKLSGGMLRRLQLAAVIMHDPILVFVDEPMAGLDPILRERMWQVLDELRDRGSTIVITTQITSEAERCDRVAMVKEGRLVALGTPDDLRQRALGGDAARVLVGGRPREAISLFWGAPGVSEVALVGENAIRVVTNENHGNLERAIELVRRRGVEVKAVEKATASFDEVFERLVRNA